MENGWETREKSKLISYVAQMMELEFERFRSVVQIVTGWVINLEIDLAGLCKRLDERMTCTFEVTQDGQVSPMLDQVVSYLHGTVSQLMQDQVVKQQGSAGLVLILKERANFHLKCNVLKSYALLMLIEINNNAEQIGEAFEDWIITSVKSENQIASAVIKTLEHAVKNDVDYLDNVKVGTVDLEHSIQRVQLDEGLPKYLTGFIVPKGMDATRLDIETLQLIFNQLKSKAHQDLLDSQTFISLIVSDYQSYKIPDRFRTLPFQAILNIISRLSQKPLTNNGESGQSPFASSLSMLEERSTFVNWKKVFLLFALASSSLPSDSQLQTYGQELAYYGNCISLEDFQNADAWFDTTESANTPSQMIKATAPSVSASEEEQEVFDTKRLKQLKKLIWQAVKRTNEEGIRAGDFVKLIRDIKTLGVGNEQTFGDLIA